MTKGSLSPEIIEGVCRLNTLFCEATKWITDRAKWMRAAFWAGGGKKDYQWGNDWYDYELEVVVKCSLGSDDPDFKPDDEYANLIVVHETSAWDHDDTWWTEFGPQHGEFLQDYNDTFRQTPFCYLFHAICIDTLHYDFDAMLKIGEIEIGIVLIRQRGIHLDTALLPRKRKSSYPRSVFARTPILEGGKRKLLNWRERRYARLLNQKMSETSLWIQEQASRSEKEYADIGGLDCRIMAGNAYEDYEMHVKVDGCLGESHPEFDPDDDNFVVEWREPIYKQSQYVFGRARNPFYSFRCYGSYFQKTDYRPHHYRYELYRIEPCGLFWRIFKDLDDDWFRMLSIGRIWIDVFFVQRRILTVRHEKDTHVSGREVTA